MSGSTREKKWTAANVNFICSKNNDPLNALDFEMCVRVGGSGTYRILHMPILNQLRYIKSFSDVCDATIDDCSFLWVGRGRVVWKTIWTGCYSIKHFPTSWFCCTPFFFEHPFDLCLFFIHVVIQTIQNSKSPTSHPCSRIRSGLWKDLDCSLPTVPHL